METIFSKTGKHSKTYSAEAEGMFRAPLQGLSESKKFRAWTKCKDSRRATRFAQTISPSALTSLPGTSRFTKTLPKSPCPHPPVPQKGSRNGACFLLYRLGKSSNNQLNEKQGAADSFSKWEVLRAAPFFRFLQSVYGMTGGENDKSGSVRKAGRYC